MSQFRLAKSTWGVEEVSNKLLWPEMFERLEADGFNVFETVFGPPGSPIQFPFTPDPELFRMLMKKHKIQLVAQVLTLGYPVPSLKKAGVDAHIADLREQALRAMEYGPILINVHGGKDSMTRADMLAFLNAACQLEKELGVPICHETHRQRILHSPFVYRDLMPDMPAEVKINADLSHWACMAERCMSMEDDDDFWPEVLADVAKRGYLIHARVGWSASAQVPDPMAPEHARDVAAHMLWWDRMAASMLERKVPLIMETEFGPYPYLPHLPYTNVPVANLWKLQTTWGRVLRERYDK